MHGDTLAGRERWKKSKESVDDDHHNICRRWSSQIPHGTVHLQVLKFDLTIFLVDYSIEKPWPDGLALAFKNASRAKATMKLSIWPGLAWPGLWPQARPCTALTTISLCLPRWGHNVVLINRPLTVVVSALLIIGDNCWGMYIIDHCRTGLPSLSIIPPQL